MCFKGDWDLISEHVSENTDRTHDLGHRQISGHRRDARRERKIMTTEHDRQDAHEQHVQCPRFATNTAHDTHEEVRAKLWGCRAWGRVDRVPA